MKKISNFTLVLLSACVAFLDNTIKNHIDKQPDEYKVSLLKGEVDIVKYRNKGFAYSMLDDRQELVKNISVFVLGMLTMVAVRDMASTDTGDGKKVANSLILGGALSNCFDRVYRKYVVDYIKVKKTGLVYNLSDFSIFAGAILTVISAICSLFTISKTN